MPLPVRQRDSAQPRPVQRVEPFRELEEIQVHCYELHCSTFRPGPGEVMRPWVPPMDIDETEDE